MALLDEIFRQPDFHDTLTEAGYIHTSRPTAEGALENSPSFKAAAARMWGPGYAMQGTHPGEAETYFDAQGKPGDINWHGGSSQVTTRMPANAPYTMHTHQNSAGSEPSTGDIASAKGNRKTMYVMSHDGLWMVEPDGSKYHVFGNSDWMSQKKGRK